MTEVQPAPPHHTADGFRNNYPTGWGRGSFWRWQKDRWANGVPQPPAGGWRFPSERPDLVFLHGNRQQPTLTWLGHATFLLQLAGLNILTDPHLSPRASPFQNVGPLRWMPPPLAFHELPHIDLVLLSHNHYDHLDRPTVERLRRQPGGEPKFMVPLGLKSWFTRLGVRNVHELDWWQSFAQEDLTLTFTPVQHWSARTTWDRNRSLWGGWRLDHPELSFFFAGDTGYSADFADTYERLGPVDLAALPIGAYEPRWFMQVMHVNPEEAVRIHFDLHARQSVAMHWGTFVLTDEPLDEPPHRLRRALTAQQLTENDFWIMRHGEMRHLHV
jgi:N-acyl-phosphatidylethanolamine-hydrolysing phospholipase D